MSPQGSGCHPCIVGIWLFIYAAENILYSSAVTLNLFTLLRGSRQVDPALFLQSRQRRVPQLIPHRERRGWLSNFWTSV